MPILRACPPWQLAVDRAHIFGVLSLIFCTMMLIVTLKYVFVRHSTRYKSINRFAWLASSMGMMGLNRPPYIVNDQRAAIRKASRSPCFTHQPIRTG